MTDGKAASIGANPRSDHRHGRRLVGFWSLGPAAIVIIAVIAAAAWRLRDSDPEQVFREAQAEARAGRYAQAMARVESLQRLRPPSPRDHLLKAQVAGGLNQTDIAVNALGAVPDDDPVGEVARLSQGQLEARRGRLRFAEDAFNRTIAHWPRNTQARKELVYIYSIQRRLSKLDEQLEALERLGALDLTHLLHWARVRHDRWSAAADLGALQRYVAADPDDRHSRLSLAEALARLARYDEAEAALKPCDAADVDALVARVHIAEARNDLPALDRLLAQGPVDHAELARVRGRLALFRRDPSAALEQFQIARKHDRFDRPTTSGLATALTMLGRAGEAEPLNGEVQRFDQLGALISKASVNPDQVEPSAARAIGLLLAAMGRTAEARAWLKPAIAGDPLDRQAHQALYRLDDDAAAAKPPSRPLK